MEMNPLPMNVREAEWDELCPECNENPAHNVVALFGGPEVLVPCTECYARLRKAEIEPAPPPRRQLPEEVFKQGWIVLRRSLGDPPHEKSYRTYFDELGTLSTQQYVAAIKACVRSLKWFPKPSEILSRVPSTLEYHQRALSPGNDNAESTNP